MEWNCNTTHFVPPPDSSLSFLYNYNQTSFQGMEVKQDGSIETLLEMEKMMKYGNQDKKKRLTSEQLETLESNFQKEIKLDPQRKMKLSKELGLQPRQIAVWFQNRRSRWKTKNLERLYDLLKHQFDVVSKEKQQLQDEVMKLKGMLKEQGSSSSCGKTQVSAVDYYHREMSGEETETIESTSEAALFGSNRVREKIHHHLNNAGGNFCFNMENNYNMNNTVPVLPYWPAVPYNYHS